MGKSSKNPIRVSVLIPAYNEKECIEPLIEETIKFINENSLYDWEFILIDDGSTDGTMEKFVEKTENLSLFKAYRLPRNQGKTRALEIGTMHAKGEILVIYDADLQFTLQDALALTKKIDENFDMVVGRKTGKYHKRFVSRIYNFLARVLFGVPVTDLNAMKVFRKEIIDFVPLRKDWHRYIVPWAYEKGYSITELPVTLRPRKYGKSKYTGVGRILVGFLDLLSVKFQITFMRKPMLLFGSLGLFSLGAGIIIGIVAFYIRIFYHQGYRPILYLIILLIMSGLLLFTLGFLAEAQAGVYDRLERIERYLFKREK